MKQLISKFKRSAIETHNLEVEIRKTIVEELGPAVNKDFASAIERSNVTINDNSVWMAVELSGSLAISLDSFCLKLKELGLGEVRLIDRTVYLRWEAEVDGAGIEGVPEAIASQNYTGVLKEYADRVKKEADKA